MRYCELNIPSANGELDIKYDNEEIFAAYWKPPRWGKLVYTFFA